jgi:hypothetical protein
MGHQTIHNLGNNFEISVVSASYAYSDQGSVEMAILHNGEFRYDLMGGDVIPYFPNNHVNDFISFVRKEIENNPNISNVNLVQVFGIN